ncbi:hypothetical protein [Streptomyces spiralis]|uniref:hypothetical protein n=1 Tax=Streptomyces spiralis TaxID=66376 RepID=UPI003404676F
MTPVPSASARSTCSGIRRRPVAAHPFNIDTGGLAARRTLTKLVAQGEEKTAAAKTVTAP